MKYRDNPILYSKEDIKQLVWTLGHKITQDYYNSNLVLVVVLKGAIVFAADLIREIKIKNLKIDFVRVSSYGIGKRESTGTIKLWKDISVDIKNKDVLIVEEIIDTGHTLKFLFDRLNASKPKSLKLCTLLDKPSKRVLDINPDYIGATIEDKYVYGYGLDLDEYCRNYSDIHYCPTNS